MARRALSVKKVGRGGSSAKATRRAPAGVDKGDTRFVDRARRLRAAIKRAGATHLLVTDPKDVGYLTGFLGGDSYLLLSASGRGRPILISDQRYEEELGAFRSLVDVRMRVGSMLDTVAQLCKELGVGSLGVQGEHMTVSLLRALHDRVGERKVRVTSGLLASLRLVKDDSEIALIRKAIRVQQSALEVALGDIEPGQTELDVCAHLEWAMKSLGAGGFGFGTIIAAGANSAKPHYHPGKAKLKRNNVLLIDFGAMIDGYTGDMTRTFTLGKWPGVMGEVYDIVLEAHERAASALAPGKTGAEVDAVARSFIASKGYGAEFSHSLGHGIGLNVHEGPGLSARSAGDVLRPGMVVTIEPGIYLPGVGGVRLENDYLVTERGCKNLCSLPMDRRWATLA